jgi:hypothetical protein
MHRSSESVAAIATALAKAQTELSNPEKAMVGTIYNNRLETSQSFRYASLSSGLDIVRKALGGHQIAIAQTTDIDRSSGTVNLTTLLLHTSGEWISSDWPVCQLSETSAPRRMGAALTYARRYALFTMVGIAGEDDLDAPPDVTNGSAEGHKAAEAGLVPNPSPEPNRPGRSGQGTTSPVREKLGAEASAAIRSQLILEIETLPGDDLQPRAIAILKAKNRLSADDAKLVGNAFAARMVQQDPTQEALTTEAPASVPTEPAPPQPPAAPSGAVKRPRGRPRKVNAVTAQSAPAPATSKPTLDDNPPASLHADASPTGSEKANSPSASRAAIATKPTSSSSPRSRVWSAAEAQPTPTTSGSPSPALWDARRATNSPCRCAEPITETTTTPETKSHGGASGRSIPWRRHGCSGYRRDASDDRRLATRPCNHAAQPTRGFSALSRQWTPPATSSKAVLRPYSQEVGVSRPEGVSIQS